MYEILSRYFFALRTGSVLTRGKCYEQYAIKRKFSGHRVPHVSLRYQERLSWEDGTMADQHDGEASAGTRRDGSIHNATGGRRSTQKDGDANSGNWPDAVTLP